MVCKKNTGDLYWFGPRSALRAVREESFVLSCTKVPVVGVTNECERGRISQVSWCEWRKWVCATLLVTSLLLLWGLFFSPVVLCWVDPYMLLL
jgi:hypothetical protein